MNVCLWGLNQEMQETSQSDHIFFPIKDALIILSKLIIVKHNFECLEGPFKHKIITDETNRFMRWIEFGFELMQDLIHKFVHVECGG